ncbi:MAG: hypothetical protein KAV82_03525 [Phycisphaerae bacterium]|nr:hypothetical protein [Phycisphaerae bacterium]
MSPDAIRKAIKRLEDRPPNVKILVNHEVTDYGEKRNIGFIDAAHVELIASVLRSPRTKKPKHYHKNTKWKKKKKKKARGKVASVDQAALDKERSILLLLRKLIDAKVSVCQLIRHNASDSADLQSAHASVRQLNALIIKVLLRRDATTEELDMMEDKGLHT